MESMNALDISTMPSPSDVKRRLAEIHDSSESEEEPQPEENKKSKKSKKRLDIFDKDWACKLVTFYTAY